MLYILSLLSTLSSVISSSSVLNFTSNHPVKWNAGDFVYMPVLYTDDWWCLDDVTVQHNSSHLTVVSHCVETPGHVVAWKKETLETTFKSPLLRLTEEQLASGVTLNTGATQPLHFVSTLYLTDGTIVQNGLTVEQDGEWVILQGSVKNLEKVQVEGFLTLPEIPERLRGCTSLLAQGGSTKCTLLQSNEVEIRNKRQYDNNGLHFDSQSYDVYLPENIPTGTTILMVSASNALDYTQTVAYTLIRDTYGSTVFEVDSMSGTVKLKTFLDHEENPIIRIPVLAENALFEKVVTEVVLEVEDVNDCAPEFLFDQYLVSVLDSTPIGSRIVQVQAQDSDSALNGQVVYKLHASKDSAMFEVNRDTGHVSVTSSLHDKLEYHITIEACDQGTPVLATNVTVSVFVQNTTAVYNADPPRFRDRVYSTVISELGRSGGRVTRVKADTISPPSSPLQYSIIQGSTPAQNSPRSFGINPDTGVISRYSAVDYDGPTPSFALLVKVRTTQMPEYVDYAQVFINLEDVNDNIPIFSSLKYVASVLENVEAGTYITTVMATDRDSGDNGKLTYSFGSGETEKFRIDPDKGHIYTTRVLDRETNSFYDFFVVATDHGNPYQNSGAKVRVNVLDVNDCPPVFRSEVIEVFLREDAQRDDIVTTLTSIDQDIGQNAAVIYNFTSGDTTAFKLESGTGIVRVNTDLDYETKQDYTIDITATDGKHSARAKLRIILEDVNDHAPQFDRERYPITTTEEVDVGTLLLKLHATDGDAGQNQQVIYEIQSRDPDLPFSIDSSSGWLSISGVLDREHTARYELIVSATDGGGLSATTQVIITVLDVNDNPPLCLPPFTGVVPENTAPGYLVMTINATDPDVGENADLKFRVLNQEAFFTINSTSGVLSVRSPLDREKEAELSLRVEVTDSSRTGRLATECDYIIKVLDENDNAPIFSQVSYTTSLSELTDIGTHFYQLDGTDADEGLNGGLDYTIISGNTPPVFDISSRTGSLFVIGRLDYEVTPEYLITVSVTDRAPPYHSTTAKVLISIEDGNDTPPVFEKTIYAVTLSENTVPGSTLTIVSAGDAEGSTTSYSLLDNFHGTFRVVESGILTLLKKLDRETTSHYSIVVIASDGGDPPLTSNCTVELRVTDENDNPPRFLMDHYQLSVSPDTDKDTSLITFELSDADGPGNGPPFALSIASGNVHDVFGVEESTLKLIRPEKLTQGSQFTLEMLAEDSGIPAYSATAAVSITVLAENRFPPIAEPLHLSLPLLGGRVIKRLVLNYTATDPDPGNILVYSLETPSQLFSLYPNGSLVSVERPPIGMHRLTVSVSDGKSTDLSTITIEVFSLESEAASNPLTIRLDSVTPESFNEDIFSRALADILLTAPEDILVLSIEARSTRRRKRATTALMLDVTVTARQSNGEFIGLERMKKLISRDVRSFESLTGYTVDSIDVDPCLREPCHISATCTATTTYGAVAGSVAAFQSSQCNCEDGYKGYRCDQLIPCQINPCNSGLCVEKEDGTEKCECGEDWTGLFCDIPVRHCLNNPCLNGGQCRDEMVGFTCSCLNGFKGKTCEVKILPDDLCEDSPCSVHSNCSAGGRDVTCSCHVGWAGKLCTYVSEEGGACARNPCLHGGQCVETEDQYRCECSVGFRGPYCEENIDECSGNPCLNDGECVDGVDGYICQCADGFSGTRCQHASQPCDANPCQNAGFCYNIDDEAYLCHCARGYVGERCETALVAPGYCSPSPCSSHAELCTAGLLGYTCTCQPTWKGVNCEEQDFSSNGCDLNPCFNGGTCISQPNGYITYTCQCEPGFKGMQCEENVDECSPGVCKNGGTCVDRTNTYECICKSGYTGRHCDIEGDPCLALPCRNNGKCSSVEDSYVCQCTSSYSGRNCETLLTYCPENQCRNGGQCGVRSDGSVRCSCPVDFFGEYCEHRYKHCSLNPCLNGGTCIEKQDGYRCECEHGYKGPQCQLLEIGITAGGYAALRLPYPLKYSSLTFKIRTRSPDGLLLYLGRYSGGLDYLYMYLTNGRLSMEYCVGGGEPARLSLSQEDVSDLRWHLITITVNSKQIALVLDDCHDTRTRTCYKSAVVSGTYYSLDTETPLYLGGVDHAYSFLPASEYQGCIADVMLDGTLLDLSKTVASSRATQGCLANACIATCSGQNVCATAGGVVSCQCPAGKTGSSCSTAAPSVTLSGNAVLSISLQQYIQPTTSLMVSIQIRTRIPDCLVYMIGSVVEEDYITLSLDEGQPSVLIQTGDTSTVLTLYGRRVDDGSWHTIVLSKVVDSLQIEVDGIHSAMAMILPLKPFKARGNVIFSFGGIPEGREVSVKSGMVGCIRDARLDNREISIISDSADATVTTRGQVSMMSCALPPTCLYSRCPSTHRCHDTWGDFECRCPAGFSGPDCSCPAGYTGDSCQYETNECRPNPCIHATECIDKANDYSCTCKPGYTGKNCDEDINECAGQPCKNGALCLDLIDGFQCRCTSRYIGSLCEMDTTPCADSPCKHGGTCTEYGAGQFGCECSEAWGGETCSLPRSCDFDPCVYGRCKSGSGSFVRCECDESYTGPTCEENECASCGPNGKSCRAGKCVCQEGWTGARCQEREMYTAQEAPLQTWVIVLVAVLASLVLLAVLVALVCRKRCVARLKYNEVPKHPGRDSTRTALHQPYFHQPNAYPQNCGPEPYNHAMFQYRPFPAAPGPHSAGNLMQMQSLNHSTQTLDNEIKL